MQQKPCLRWDGSFGDVGLSSPAWYGCLTLVLLSVPTLFRNKSLHIIWLSNLVTGNDGCKIETTHIQSQRARLRITLEQVIKKILLPWKPSVPPATLASLSWRCRLAGFSFCQLTLAGIGIPCIWQPLSPLLSSSSELPGFGQRLQGALWSPSRHLGFRLGSWLVMMYT